jgi:RNA polymerase sigma factor (sigma-70 family)
MPANAGRDVSHLLRQLALREGDTLTDGVLLAAFVQRRDENALTALVHRHGGMVWGVCRRLLGDGHDAEDAFQATFLVLVRKAAGLRNPDRVACWLYGVARQTAVRMRALRARQGSREKQVPTLPERASPDPEPGSDLAPILDEELSRLPDKYRAVLILCDLQEKPRGEVARQLGCPEGTVAGRLARARALLADRLTRRGVTTPPGSVVVMPAPPALIPATVQVVLTGAPSATVVLLTQGVLNAMFLKPLKVGLAIVLSLALCSTGGLLVYSSGQSPQPPGQPTPPPEKPPQVRADPKEPRELPEAIAKAWFPASGIGWMRLTDQGALSWSDQPQAKVPDAIPGFHMIWVKGTLPTLPDPGIPFGIHLRGVHDEGLKDLARFPSLKALDLSLSPVSWFGIQQLAGMKNLQWLDLSSSNVGDMGLKELAPMTNLQALTVDMTTATDASMKDLAGLKNLRSLHLKSMFYAKVTAQGLKELAALTRLQVLHLSGTPAADAALAALTGMKDLRVLGISAESVTDAGIKSLAGLTKMQSLDLSGTKLTDVGLKELSGLTNLRELKIGNTKLTDAGLKELAGMTELQSLDLWATAVTDTGLKELANLTKLQSLSLRGTRISDAGLKELMGLKNLRHLDLGSRTKVTDAGAAALKKALPACAITGLSED